MAKIFQLTVFLNFVIVGIAVGYARTHVNLKRLALLFLAYFVLYAVFGYVVLADISFLVPEP